MVEAENACGLNIKTETQIFCNVLTTIEIKFFASRFVLMPFVCITKENCLETIVRKHLNLRGLSESGLWHVIDLSLTKEDVW